MGKSYRPFRRDLMRRRIKRAVIDVGLIVVAVPTLVFVAKTLDHQGASVAAPATRPTLPPAAFRTSARAEPVISFANSAGVGAAGRLAVRYSGDPGCDSAPAKVERSTDGGRTWHKVTTRVAHPTAVVVVGKYVLLTGRNDECGWVTQYSYDNGASYVIAPAVLDSTTLAIGSHAWGIGGQGALLRGTEALTQIDRQETPCPAHSAAAFVGASGTTVWVLCRGATSLGVESRLVRASYDEGVTWADLARSATVNGARRTGLDGRGRVDGFGFVDATHGWLLLRGTSRCAGNDADVRVTGDGGRNWTALPCVPPRLAQNVQSVAFASPLDAVLLATTRSGAVTTVATTNGGATWSTRSR